MVEVVLPWLPECEGMVSNSSSGYYGCSVHTHARARAHVHTLGASATALFTTKYKHLSRDRLTKRLQSLHGEMSGLLKKKKKRPPFTRHQTRKDGQSDSGRFEVLTLFFRRWSPCFSSPGRSRILCFSWAWSLALLFHRKPASKPSSAGSESSMVPLLLLSVLEPPLCLPALPVPTISSKGAPPPAPVRHFPPPRAPTQRPASAAEPRADLTTYSMYSAARDAAAPPNGSSVLLFGRLLPGSCVCVSVLSAGGGVTGASEHCITFTSHPPPACLHRGKYSQGLVELAP